MQFNNKVESIWHGYLNNNKDELIMAGCERGLRRSAAFRAFNNQHFKWICGQQPQLKAILNNYL